MNRTPVCLLVPVLALAVSVSACSKKDATSHSMAERAPAASTAAPAPTSDTAAADEKLAADTAAPAAAAHAKPKGATPAKPFTPTAPELAYAYQYGVEAPPAAVPMLVRLHESVCAAAGAVNCQVVSANTTAVGKDDAAGHLEIRGEPNWLRGFRGRIEDDVKAAHGKLQGSQIETEDLSRSIVDTEAQLRAKKTLRDRMQGLLATHKSKLSDLVDLEQQVSSVQGEIDAAESELAAMKTRVATARLTIDYRSSLALAPNSAFGHLSAAGHGFVRHFMDMLGFLLTLLSYFLPFGLVVGIGWWVFKKRPRAIAPKAEG